MRAEDVHKIERVCVIPRGGHSSYDFRVFCRTLLALKPGESFVADKLTTNHRIAICAAQHFFDGRVFATNAQFDGKHRVGRIS